MKSHVLSGKTLVVGVSVLLCSVMLRSSSAFAATASSIDPVQISPVCSSASASTATWQAYNKNDTSVDFNWKNLDTNVSGDYTAPANSTTTFTTNYSVGQNNQTEFTNEGSTSPVDRNATNTPCEETTPVTPVVPVVPTTPTTPTGGMGGGTTTTPPVTTVATTPVATVTTPVVTATPAASLVDTGLNIKLVSVLAALTAAVALFVGTRRSKVSE